GLLRLMLPAGRPKRGAGAADEACPPWVRKNPFCVLIFCATVPDPCEALPAGPAPAGADPPGPGPAGAPAPPRPVRGGAPGPAGVGSNGSHPSPLNQTSTQACASRSVTSHWFWFESYFPPAKPTATRAGTPR